MIFLNQLLLLAMGIVAALAYNYIRYRSDEDYNPESPVRWVHPLYIGGAFTAIGAVTFADYTLSTLLPQSVVGWIAWPVTGFGLTLIAIALRNRGRYQSNGDSEDVEYY